MNLSSGEAQTFELKFKRAEDYPIDLYYLMDLSFSMKDDLENVKNLGTHLMNEMQDITSDFRIGKTDSVREKSCRCLSQSGVKHSLVFNSQVSAPSWRRR